MSNSSQPTSARDLLPLAAKLVPPLTDKLHKGQGGRVGVVGGSKDYTGAPFYSSFASLRLGADLAHVICEPSAGAVIKTYSPDIIVHTIISEQDDGTFDTSLGPLLSRLHVLVVGPGLGREDYMQSAAYTAIARARTERMYIVIDADGLWLVQNDPDVIKGYEKAVLTPNVVEFERLCKKLGISTEGDPNTRAQELSKALGGPTIIQKGAQDIIANANEVVISDEAGGLKRSGGQGDILSGVIGTFLAWGKSWAENEVAGKESSGFDVARIPVLAAAAGSIVTRTTSRLAFEEKGRSVQTSDMLSFVQKSFEHHFGEEVARGTKGGKL